MLFCRQSHQKDDSHQDAKYHKRGTISENASNRASKHWTKQVAGHAGSHHLRHDGPRMSLWRFTGHKGRRVVDVTRKSSLQKSQKDNHVDVGCKSGQKNGKRHHAGSTQTHQLASFSICQIAPIRRNNGLSKISNRKCQSGIKIDLRPAVMAETFNVKSHKRHCHRKTKSSDETP